MKIQDALDLHLKEEASRIIGDKRANFGRACATCVDFGHAPETHGVNHRTQQVLEILRGFDAHGTHPQNS